jgi:hypothetical protein
MLGVETVPKTRKTTGGEGQSKTVRISAAAYAVLGKLAGLRGMDLGDCASDLLLRHGTREAKDEARKLLKGDDD